MPVSSGPTTAETTQVLAEVAAMITQIFGDYAVDEAQLGLSTSFHDDLELESIDLVALAGLLVEAYGEQVNLAEYLAEKDLAEVIALTVGDVVEYVLVATEQA